MTVFFFDRNTAPRVARAFAAMLDGAGVVEHLDDVYAPTTADTVWLSDLAARHPGAVVVTVDNRIRQNKGERAALAQSNLTVFFCAKHWASVTAPELGGSLIRLQPRMFELLTRQRAPSCYNITAGAKVEELGLTLQM